VGVAFTPLQDAIKMEITTSEVNIQMDVRFIDAFS
jgi:hypothetical protein